MISSIKRFYKRYGFYIIGTLAAMYMFYQAFDTFTTFVK